MTYNHVPKILYQIQTPLPKHTTEVAGSRCPSQQSNFAPQVLRVCLKLYL